MTTPVLGIHHVSAIATDPQRNVDFYAGVLGLRLVKRTVNFDDPQSYHLYYGDAEGTPGSLLTFFPWPGARRGQHGSGQVAVTALAALPGALGFWVERLVRHAVPFQGPTRRGSGADAERVLAFSDPDGLMLEIVGHERAGERGAWDGAPGITAEHALRGLHAVTLWADRGEETARVLADTLGFREVSEREGTHRFGAGDGGPGTIVELRTVGGFLRGTGGAGTVHHVAWRVSDDAAQLALRDRVAAEGLDPTAVIDRRYFDSVYFREPGGVLFELATDAPGFTIDEPASRLGEALMLPPRYESRRARIEAALPPIHLPTPATAPLLAGDEGGPEDISGDALGFVHRYLPPASEAAPAAGITLLLLHGTGGDEHDLVPLGRSLLPGAGLLSPRGNVLEFGAPRFFRRLSEGVLDQPDLERRTHELATFVLGATASYALRRDAVIAVGFSNGANIAVSLLLRHPGLLRGAVLLSPMLPYEPTSVPDLVDTDVFIGAGRADPLVPVDRVERLAELLSEAGASVTIHWTPDGHAIVASELDAARQWMERVSGEARQPIGAR
ncbi:MAG: VOC family protein [Gemmatimonadaceae bacterium]